MVLSHCQGELSSSLLLPTPSPSFPEALQKEQAQSPWSWDLQQQCRRGGEDAAGWLSRAVQGTGLCAAMGVGGPPS